MRRAEKRGDLTALIESFPARTLAAKLRPLLPAIERRLGEGVRLSEIVETLNQDGRLGVELRTATLKKYLFRFRRTERVRSRLRRGHQGSERLAATEESSPPLRAPPSAPAPVPSPAVAVEATPPRRAVTPSLIRQIRNEEVDLDAYAEIGKALTKKNGRQGT